MRILIIIVILIIFYFIFRGEMFTNCDYVKIPWATYSSLDGKHLNYTTREEIPWIEYNLSGGIVELWGYRGAGIPEVDDMYFAPQYDVDHVNSNWILLLRAHTGQKKLHFGKFKAYHLNITFPFL